MESRIDSASSRRSGWWCSSRLSGSARGAAASGRPDWRNVRDVTSSRISPLVDQPFSTNHAARWSSERVPDAYRQVVSRYFESLAKAKP